jgi:hypothetical protein
MILSIAAGGYRNVRNFVLHSFWYVSPQKWHPMPLDETFHSSGASTITSNFLKTLLATD